MNTSVISVDNGAQKSLRLLDKVFAQWLVDHFAEELSTSEKADLLRICMAVSFAVHLKHTCLDLDELNPLGDKDLISLLEGIDKKRIRKILTQKVQPLTVSADGNKIWLQKYYFFEQQCVKSLIAMLHIKSTIDEQDQERLALMFPEPSEQKEAAQKALQYQLAVITGGPGTGKTFTVARIIALLLQAKPSLRIVLAAPTGKAAQRMKEALDHAIMSSQQGNLFSGYEYLLDNIPAKASTLHSLLGIGYGSPKPRRHHLNPLALDVLIIDEASMIDLPMMYRLLDALPRSAKLILLGDKDQLASVEAGSVLAEICQSEKLANCMANITFSRRFGDASEIGRLAKWLNNASISDFPDMSKNTAVRYHSLSADQPWNPAWLPLALEKYQLLQTTIFSGVSILDILQQQKNFQVLCALREGPYGVAGINSIIEKALFKSSKTVTKLAAKSWYVGMPVIVLQNDNERKLFNGDMGIVLPLNKEGSEIDISSSLLKACFLAGDGFKAISPTQMPSAETCYAITVHKSQGSEYKHVLVVLPANVEDVKNNPVLTKELAYTAVTRASESIDLWAGEGVLDVMVSRKTVRMSGLADLLDDKVHI